ncbi:MAG: exodeoxyribonuclease VII large subunit [Proteobacteria bacterium]|nr:exodeoxyribonuclease VII large subunit [Pseudomonadota bacterium]
MTYDSMDEFLHQVQDTEKTKEIPIFSVTQVSNLLKRHVESKFLNIKVKGEISGLKVHTSGHAYFTIKDQDAIIDGVIWRGTPLSVKLEDGISLIVTGRITTYPARSKYQMVVEKVEPAGLGELMKLLLERKAQFQKEGLFDKARPLPKFPKIIGVITSPTGAVIQDIIHRIKDRYPCHILLWPVLVQGTGAAEQVANAVKGFNDQTENKPDVLIIARGGGSFEDLWPFNDELIVRSVYNSQIPIVSAIGHETDTTLTDFAADLRAPTPTAAAELVTPVLSDLILSLTNTTQRLRNAFANILKSYQMRYQLAIKSLIGPERYLQEKAQRLDDWADRLLNLKKSIMLIYGQRLSVLLNRLQSPKMHADMQAEKLKYLSERLHKTISLIVLQNTQKIEHLSLRLNQSSYQKTLEKGFCLVMDNHKSPLESVKDFLNNNNKPVTFQTKDGKIETVLKDVKIT